MVRIVLPPAGQGQLEAALAADDRRGFRGGHAPLLLIANDAGDGLVERVADAVIGHRQLVRLAEDLAAALLEIGLAKGVGEVLAGRSDDGVFLLHGLTHVGQQLAEFGPPLVMTAPAP